MRGRQTGLANSLLLISSMYVRYIPSFSEESSQLFRSASGRSGGKYSSRGAFALTKQPSVFTVRRSSVGDRAWDYDVFPKSDEELMMHAIDIFRVSQYPVAI